MPGAEGRGVTLGRTGETPVDRVAQRRAGNRPAHRPAEALHSQGGRGGGPRHPRSSAPSNALSRTLRSGGSRRSHASSATTSPRCSATRPSSSGPVHTARRARPDRARQGYDFAALHVPGTTLELTIASLAPRAGYGEGVTHAGIDVLVVAEGEFVVADGADDPLCEGACAVWPSSHPLTVRNDSATPAGAIGVATEAVY